MLSKFQIPIKSIIRQQVSSLLNHRVIAVDLGSSRIKVVLAEQSKLGICFLEHRCLDLQTEGLLSLVEINKHIQEVVDDLGNMPVALALPQHLTQSHLIELPNASPDEIREMVSRETISLSGLSDSAIVYDYHALEPWGRHLNSFWVTIAQEQEINAQLNRLLTANTERSYVEVTSAANALIVAYLMEVHPEGRVILADIGSTSTVVAVIEAGQGVFATSFPIGGESFTNAIVALNKGTFEEAEALKRTRDLFAGPGRLNGFHPVVDFWQQEFEKIVGDWLGDNVELRADKQSLSVVLSGGAAYQPGLVPYLRSRSAYEYQLWPGGSEKPEAKLSAGCFAIANGLAYQALRPDRYACSLLPQYLRKSKKRQHYLMKANWAALWLIGILFALLLAGSAFKGYLKHHKSNLLHNAELAHKKALSVESLISQKELDYAGILPLVEKQKRTRNALETLLVLQQVRERRDLWFVLVADSASYEAGETWPAVHTNAPVAAAVQTNAAILPDGFVAELSISDKVGDKLKELGALVGELKKVPLFRNVDVLASNQRNTNIMDSKVVAPDRYYSLALALAEPEAPAPMLRSAVKTNAVAGPATK
jgi:Tfp pilus assembly PilM family ATPase